MALPVLLRIGVGTMPLPEHTTSTGQEQDQKRNRHNGPRGMSPRPQDHAFRNAGTPGTDRLVAKEMIEIIRQFSRRGVAATRLFLEALEADGFQVGRNGGIKRTQSRWLVCADLQQNVGSGRAEKRRTSGQQVKQNRAKTPDVRCGSDASFARGLLR